MMKNILALLLLAGTLTPLHAQDEPAPSDTLSPWKFGGLASLNASQLAFSPQWAAGGESSLAGNALLNLMAHYKNPDSTINWTNDLTMGFGLIKQGEDPTRKSDDKIDFASKIGYRASKRWFYSGLLSFRSQFAEGYANPGAVNRTRISNFLAPA